MANLGQKPSGIYYLDVLIPDGTGALKRQRVSTNTRDRVEAEAQRRDWLAGLHPKHPSQGGVVAPKGHASRTDGSTSRETSDSEPTIKQWLRACLSDPNVWGLKTAVKNHQSAVAVLGRVLPSDPRLSEVSNAFLLEAQKALWDAGYKLGTVKKNYNYLTRALRYAHEIGKIGQLPLIPKITGKVQPRDRVVSYDEERVLLECVAKRVERQPLRAWWHMEQLLVLLLDTGCRLGELLSSGPSNLVRRRFVADGQPMESIWLNIRRVQTKSDSGVRQIPLSQRALASISQLNDRAVAGRWFPWKPGSSTPITMFDQLRDDVLRRGYDLSDVVLHSFRHTCLTRLAEGGMDLLGLRDWAGHSDIKITAGTYLHLCTSHLHRGAAILDAQRSSPLPNTIGVVDGLSCSIPDSVVCGRDRDELGTVGAVQPIEI
jgi:integrase